MKAIELGNLPPTKSVTPLTFFWLFGLEEHAAKGHER